ncbi:MAG: site-2 protease family protein [Candidatus Thermoplasmatota archaeon]
MAGPYTPPPPPGPWNTIPDIEMIKGLVGKHFPIYETRVSHDAVSLYCTVDPMSLEREFDALRREMKGFGYTPIITYEGGEHIIHVVKVSRPKPFGVWVNAIFFVATIVTTVITGAMLHASYRGWEDLYSPRALTWGFLTFSLPLLCVLGAHELSHYFAARRHGISASLPFFIPGFPPFGTFGALISIREPIPSKKALLDIGAAGPAASFLASIPLVLLGMHLTNVDPGVPIENIGGTMYLGDSVIFVLLLSLVPVGGMAPLHPLAFAGWVGLFVTGINLIPSGQLDGGHIARALLGEKSKYVGYAALGIMFVLSLTVFFGWILFALFVLIMGARHPPPLNDITPLDAKRKALGAFMVFVLVTSFMAIPMGSVEERYEIAFYADESGEPNLTAPLTGVYVLGAKSNPVSPSNATLTIWVANNGNMMGHIRLQTEVSRDLIGEGWNVLFVQGGNRSEELPLNLSSGEAAPVNLMVIIPPNYVGNETFELIGGTWRDTQKEGGELIDEQRLAIKVEVTPP